MAQPPGPWTDRIIAGIVLAMFTVLCGAMYTKLSSMAENIASIKATLESTSGAAKSNSLEIKEMRVRIQEIELRLERLDAMRAQVPKDEQS